jgi:holo-[acyl-carrier protein] synthase
MILGIGTDIVHIKRLQKWSDFSYDQLRRVFAKQELIDASRPASLAARFAAKEAFFKALSTALVKLGYTNKEFSMLFLCRHVSVVKSTWDVPVLKIDWAEIEAKIEQKLPKLKVELSISHEKEYAVAFVIIFSE